MNTEREYLTVSQLNEYLKNLLEEDYFLSDIPIKGEISNFTLHRSGHMYFTLKDASCAVRAVMFRSAAERVRFLPENGLKVLIRGRVSVFVRDGTYQVYVNDMQPDGIGGLYLAYEQLKKKLEAEGLFDSARKRELPKIPSRVGVITSPTGAAVRDIMQVLGRRFPFADVVLFPALVQGEGAVPSLMAGVAYFNRASAVDVIIIGRGGGSIEDLWAFNSEELARCIASSHIPVISAVGHETDFTICDFVADKRAPTPSAAAELAVPDTAELMRKFRNVTAHTTLLLERFIALRREQVLQCAERRVFQNPTTVLEERQLRLGMLEERMEQHMTRRMLYFRAILAECSAKLEAMSPLAVLSRGYSVVTDAKGKTVKSVSALRENDLLTLRMTDGTVETTVGKIETL